MQEENSEYPTHKINSKKNATRYLSYIFILLGLLVSVYLFYDYLNIAKAASEGRISLCTTIFGKGCDNALQSSFSTQLGLPLAGWGIIFYLLIILFLLIPSLFGKSFKPEAALLIYLATLAGLLAAVGLLAVMLINTSLFCPFCTIIHIINIILFFLLNRLSGYSARNFLQDFKTIPSFFTRVRTLPTVRWKIIGLFTIAIFAASLYFTLKAKVASATRQSLFIDSKPIIAEYESQVLQNIPVYDDDAMDGRSDSLIQVVVFSDFYCPGCRKFSEEISQVIKESKGRYQVVFKHFPLSSTCNPVMKKDLHPLACEAALAAEAANKQGKFWAYHDSLFAAEPITDPAGFRTIAEEVGLNLQQFDEYIHSKEAMQKVFRSVLIGKEIGIESTPTVFLNGRRAKDLRLGILRFLIDREVEKKAGRPVIYDDKER